MRFTQGKPKDRFRFLINPRHAIVPLLLAAFATVASGQLITGAPCQAPKDATGVYPTPPALVYPMTSDQYSVEYKVNNHAWTAATVYISEYGGTNSSPYLRHSGYTKVTSPVPTSMSFVSIPAGANANVEIRVTKLFDAPFKPTDNVSIRPSAQGIAAVYDPTDGTAFISTTTPTKDDGFAGEQFLLWWNRDSVPAQGGAIQGLAFFLNPIYDAPATAKTVKTIDSSADLTGLSDPMIDTLDFEGVPGTAITIDGTYGTPPVVIKGAGALTVPSNIKTIFFGPNAWVQGKLIFESGHVTIRGPGVLDLSRFQYDLRACDSKSGYADEGLNALSSPTNELEHFELNGIIISDTNHAANDLLHNSTVNNVKTLGWNAENGGIRFKNHTTASNLFVRSGDDSLMLWGSHNTITNATVWQNYNGGVVNLGWQTNSKGDDNLIDGLWVVKTDWRTPPSPPAAGAPSWDNTGLDDQNNAVIASLMLPGTKFGAKQTSLFQNIFLEDAPRIFLSLKILDSNCAANATRGCPVGDPTQTSVLNLDLKNVFTPPSTLRNSIGFQNFEGLALPGSMNVSLMNFFIVEGSTATALTSGNASSLGDIVTNGDDVNVEYNPIIAPPPPPLCKLYICL